MTQFYEKESICQSIISVNKSISCQVCLPGEFSIVYQIHPPDLFRYVLYKKQKLSALADYLSFALSRSIKQ